MGQRYQHDLLQQGRLQRGNGSLDECAAIVERFDADAGRQARRDLCDLLLHVVDDGHGVPAVAHDHDAAHDFLSVNIQRSAPEITAELDGGHVAQINRRAGVGFENDVLHILHVFD